MLGVLRNGMKMGQPALACRDHRCSKTYCSDGFVAGKCFQHRIKSERLGRAEVVGDVAYVASREQGLGIIDISDPSAPSIIDF